MPYARRAPARCLCLVALPIALIAGAARGQVIGRWTQPISGDWSNPARWNISPFYPNSTFYGANINAVGAPYVITLDTGAAISVFTLSTPSATLRITGDLDVLGQAGIDDATVELVGHNLWSGGLAMSRNAVIHGRGNLISHQGGWITNAGTISADVAGATMQIQGNAGQFDNHGTIQSVGGARLSVTGLHNAADGIIRAVDSTLTLDGAWSSQGRIEMTNSTLNLGGQMTLASLSVLSCTGGTVNLTGALNLGGGTFDLNAATGSWNLLNGTISNGTLNRTQGARLDISSGTLNNVTFNGDLEPVGNSLINLINLRMNGTLTFRRGGGAPMFQGDQSFSSGTLRMINSVPAYLYGTLTIGAQATVSGSGSFSPWGTPGAIVNQGHILASDPGAGISLVQTGYSGVPLTNSGIVEAGPGARLELFSLTNLLGGVVRAGPDSTVSIANGWSNAGTIIADHATLNFGGPVTLAGVGRIVAQASKVHLNGVLDLGRASMTWGELFTDIRGNGGLKNGLLTVPTGEVLHYRVRDDVGTNTYEGGSLRSMFVSGDILVDSPVSGEQSMHSTLSILAGLSLTGTLRVQGGFSGVCFAGTQRFDTGTVLLRGDGPSAPANLIALPAAYPSPLVTVTIGPAAAIRASHARIEGSNSTMVLYGSLTSDTAGAAVDCTIPSLTNHGSVRVASGATLSLRGLWNAGDGTIEAAPGSTLTLRDDWTNSGRIVANGANLYVGGAFSWSRFGNFERASAPITITGSLDNANGALNADDVSGVIAVAGATVNGAVINIAPGRELAVSGSREVDVTDDHSTLFDGVTINGDLRVSHPVASYRRTPLLIHNSLMLHGVLRAVDPNVSVAMEGSQRFDSGEIRVSGTPDDTKLGINSIVGTYIPPVMTVGPQARIDGSGRVSLYSSTSAPTVLTLEGLLQADEPRKTLFVNAARPSWYSTGPDALFTNSGTIAAINGGTLVIGPTISITNLQGGTLSGGKWLAGRASMIDLGTRQIRTNAADIDLEGAGASLPALGYLSVNTGSLTLGPEASLLLSQSLASSGRLNVSSAARVYILGDLTLLPADTLTMTLAAAPALTTVQVDENAVFGGGLTINIADPAALVPGTRYTLITARHISGAFDSISVPPVNPNINLNIYITSESLVVDVVPAPAALSLAALAILAITRRRRA